MIRSFADLSSPIGRVRVVARDGAICRVDFETHAGFEDSARGDERPDDPLLARALVQLREYFAGERAEFDLPLEPEGGTPFQRRAWKALREIPFGQTRTYGDQARAIQHPTAVRAVGAANGRNPIGIIVPCHRVIGSDGKLTGYAGGMAAKRWLLEHEARVLGASDRHAPALSRTRAEA